MTTLIVMMQCLQQLQNFSRISGIESLQLTSFVSILLVSQSSYFGILIAAASPTGTESIECRNLRFMA